MTGEGMDLERFAAIIDAYGARPERWPEAERAAAEALLAQSPAARAALAEARALDGLLDAVPALAPTAELRAAILAAAPRGARAAGLLDPWIGLWRELGGWRLAGAALAASLVLGILAGGTLPAPQAADDASPDLLQMALLDNGYAGY